MIGALSGKSIHRSTILVEISGFVSGVVQDKLKNWQTKSYPCLYSFFDDIKIILYHMRLKNIITYKRDLVIYESIDPMNAM